MQMWRGRLQERKGLAFLAEWDVGGKKYPSAHEDCFFSQSLKPVKPKKHWMYARTSCQKRSYQHRSQNKLRPFERLISKHLGELAPHKLARQNECHINTDNVFRETCRHLEELGWEWLQRVDVGRLSSWLLSLGHNTYLSGSVRCYCARGVLELYTPSCTGLLQAEPMDQRW